MIAASLGRGVEIAGVLGGGAFACCFVPAHEVFVLDCRSPSTRRGSVRWHPRERGLGRVDSWRERQRISALPRRNRPCELRHRVPAPRGTSARDVHWGRRRPRRVSGHRVQHPCLGGRCVAHDAVSGSYQIGEVQARSWISFAIFGSVQPAGRSASGRARQVRQLHLQLGFSTART